MRLRPAVPILLTLSCLGCDEAPTKPAPAQASPKTTPNQTAKPRPSARPLRPLSVPLGIAWSDPDGWLKQDSATGPTPTDVRRATYQVPKVEGDAEDAEVGVFYFGKSMGGNLNANLQRWAGQFGKSTADGKLTESVKGDIGLSIFDLQGTYQAGRPMGPKTPKPGFAMVGVVVKTKATGNYFFKLTGPEKTVLSARPKLLNMVEGIREVPPAAK